MRRVSDAIKKYQAISFRRYANGEMPTQPFRTYLKTQESFSFTPGFNQVTRSGSKILEPF
jgi:hypothetical protein